jgi:hypothetical protein
MMKNRALAVVAGLCGIVAYATGSIAAAQVVAGQAVDADGAPQYRVDPFWPKPLPNRWSMQQVVWNMRKRVERSPAEQARLREAAASGGPAAPDEERIRYEFSDAPPGRYRIVMRGGAQELERTLTILREEWWMERR